MFLNDDLDNSRLVIKSDDSGFVATVKLTKNLYLLVFIGIWLTFWVIGGGYASLSIISTGKLLSDSSWAYWILIWLAATLFSSYIWLWNLVGEEVIQGNRQNLLITYRIFGLRRAKTFPMQAISDLRINISKPSFFGGQLQYKWMGLTGDAIFFKMNQVTCHFGRRLSLQNASKLVEVINRYRSN